MDANYTFLSTDEVVRPALALFVEGSCPAVGGALRATGVEDQVGEGLLAAFEPGDVRKLATASRYDETVMGDSRRARQ